MKRALTLSFILSVSIAHISLADSNIESVNIDTESTSAIDSSMGEAETETNFDLETIDVDGLSKTKTKKERVSMADRMKVMRDRMEKRTADMVLRNIEKTRIKMELDMMKKINYAMEAQMGQNLKALE